MKLGRANNTGKSQYVLRDDKQLLYPFGSRKQVFNRLVVANNMKNEKNAMEASVTMLARIKPGFFFNNENAAKPAKIKYENVRRRSAAKNALPNAWSGSGLNSEATIKNNEK
jgi:hypothetical protein